MNRVKIISFGRKIPEQVRRLSLILVFLIIAFFIVTSLLIPLDFGEYGHFRTSAVEEIASQEMHYAGQEVCAECHDDIHEVKMEGYHKNLSCEVCHGPSLNHTEEPESFLPPAPRDRDYCPVCHNYLLSRPTGFPQIIAESHNPFKPCISCHDPHNPIPPQTPKDCSACHAEIARSLAISHHAYLPCARCHEAQIEHKVNPRENLPSKPKDRSFCGECHSEEAGSDKGIRRIDMETHEERYVCWQCHYPHLPEVQQ